jgi:prophage tail gpP-like protein
LFFTDKTLFRTLAPLLAVGARAFLRQDADMVDLQQKGLKHNPRLMLVEDSDTQAKWYYGIKKEWAASRLENREFQNPVTSKTLKWRS